MTVIDFTRNEAATIIAKCVTSVRSELVVTAQQPDTVRNRQTLIEVIIIIILIESEMVTLTIVADVKRRKMEASSSKVSIGVR